MKRRVVKNKGVFNNKCTTCKYFKQEIWKLRVHLKIFHLAYYYYFKIEKSAFLNFKNRKVHYEA